jgi:hypothetical protein
LLRTSGLFEYAHQRRTLARALMSFTVQSLEMREILLSKFGPRPVSQAALCPFSAGREILPVDR